MLACRSQRCLIALIGAALVGAVVLTAGLAGAGDWDERYAQEAPRIAPYQNRVLRVGDELHLQLANGQEIVFANPPGYCQHPDLCPAVHTFDGFVLALTPNWSRSRIGKAPPSCW